MGKVGSPSSSFSKTIVTTEERTRKIDQSKFEAEANLQEYIYDNPEVLPIEEDIPFIIAAREVPTNSTVGLDKNGNTYKTLQQHR